MNLEDRPLALLAMCIVGLIVFACVGGSKIQREQQAEADITARESRSRILANLNEDGIPIFKGNYHLKFVTFPDSRHPEKPTFQYFEILGVKTTDDETVYYLFDEGGYTSTLSFAHNGIPTWRPNYKIDSTNLDINPNYLFAERCALEGDFSVQFVYGNSSNFNTP